MRQRIRHRSSSLSHTEPQIKIPRYLNHFSTFPDLHWVRRMPKKGRPNAVFPPALPVLWNVILHRKAFDYQSERACLKYPNRLQQSPPQCLHGQCLWYHPSAFCCSPWWLHFWQESEGATPSCGDPFLHRLCALYHHLKWRKYTPSVVMRLAPRANPGYSANLHE